VIVVREVSRLSRVAQARRAVEELMIEWGLAVCNARSGMVYSEGEGLGASVIWTIEAKMAEAELAERSFRTTMGKNGKASRGLMPSGKARYGYRWSGGEDSKLIVDEVTAGVVREVFQMVADGKTCPYVARALDARGTPSPARRRAGWRSQTIHKMVTSRAYIGEHEYGQIHYKKLNSERERTEWSRAYFTRTGTHPKRIPVRVRVDRPEGDENRYAVQVPVIVEAALWERANKMLERTKRDRRKRPRQVMLLQGLLRCESCGRTMNSTWAYKRNVDKFYYYYRCSTNEPSRIRCRETDRKSGRTAQVSAALVESEVWCLVDEMLAEPAVLGRAVGARLDELDSAEPGQDSRIERHQRRLDTTRLAWDKARRLHFAGKVGDDDYERDREHYEREIEVVEDELRRMRAATEQRLEQRNQMVDLENLSERWQSVREQLTAEEQREIIWALVNDVTISADDEVTITGTLTSLAGWTKEVLAPRQGLEPRT